MANAVRICKNRHVRSSIVKPRIQRLMKITVTLLQLLQKVQAYFAYRTISTYFVCRSMYLGKEKYVFALDGTSWRHCGATFRWWVGDDSTEV